MVCLPTFALNLWLNVGKYAINGLFGVGILMGYNIHKGDHKLNKKVQNLDFGCSSK